MADPDKTEKPTPKRKSEARKKGQVAKSTDLNGAVVLSAGLIGLIAVGPAVVSGVAELDALHVPADLDARRGHQRRRPARAVLGGPAHGPRHGGDRSPACAWPPA